MRLRAFTASGLAVLAAFGVAACGSSDKKSSSSSTSGSTSTSTASVGKQVSIYSSQPLQGATKGQAQSVINGEKMALTEAGGKGGTCPIKYVPMDDSTAAAGQWDPASVAQNARRAAQDPSTGVYLGEFNSGASAIAIPILNQVPILEISPSNTYVGLTKSAGAEKGEPQKYYPSGKRNFGRVVPADNIQAAAVVEYMQQEGVTKLFILNDGETYGSGIARNVAIGAKAAGIDVLGNQKVDEKAANYRGVAANLKAKGADGFFFGGNTYGGAIQLWKDVYAALPNIKMFGPDGVAEESFYGQVGPPGKNTFITVSTLPAKYYPPAAQKFFTDYEAKYNVKPETYAIYGYEAMSVALDAMSRAKDCSDRQQILDAFFATKDRDSVLGKYSIDPDGDTTLTRYGAYKVQGKDLVFNKVLEPKAN